MNEVFELRQYTLHPGQRDVLIEIFEREFIHVQEELGIRVLGAFRDLDRPDRFVWFRGFADMVQRKEALTAFYTGPAWYAHRDAANATMIDWHDVHLLRLADPSRGFPTSSGTSRFTISIDPAGTPPNTREPLALLETEPSANTYEALPVWTDENVVVSLYAGDVAPSGYGRHLRLEATEKSALR